MARALRAGRLLRFLRCLVGAKEMWGVDEVSGLEFGANPWLASTDYSLNPTSRNNKVVDMYHNLDVLELQPCLAVLGP